MSHASMLEPVKAELDYVDAEALQPISEIINQAKRKAAIVPRPVVGSTPTSANKAMTVHSPSQFVGENWTLEEFERLSPEERAMRKWRLKEKNHAWLQEKFSTLNAAWVVVVDGKVVASGKRLEKKPVSPQLMKIHHQTGKFPFVFVNDKLIAIEEFEKHQHLNRDFVYVDKAVRVELPINSSATLTLDTLISCVRNWHASPLVEINPNRIALIGRNIVLKLKPKVLLDFEKRQTEIEASVKPEPTRRKSAIRKKRTPRRR